MWPVTSAVFVPKKKKAAAVVEEEEDEEDEDDAVDPTSGESEAHLVTGKKEVAVCPLLLVSSLSAFCRLRVALLKSVGK